jgi:hypothetical protein
MVRGADGEFDVRIGGDGRFAEVYGTGRTLAAVVVRPDGRPGRRGENPTVASLVGHLHRTLLPRD